MLSNCKENIAEEKAKVHTANSSQWLRIKKALSADQSYATLVSNNSVSSGFLNIKMFIQGLFQWATVSVLQKFELAVSVTPPENWLHLGSTHKFPPDGRQSTSTP